MGNNTPNSASTPPASMSTSVMSTDTTQDDHALPPTPISRHTARPEFCSQTKGLSLQMPAPSQFPPTPSSTCAPAAAPAPLSPQIDQRDIFMQQSQLSASPVTALPRHSRGLDYARACTNLHHSTLPDCSHDSSPVIAQRGMSGTGRHGSVTSMMLDSPGLSTPSSTSLAGPDRASHGFSIRHVNMRSDSEGSESDDDASMGCDDLEDPIHTTPQVHKLQNPNAHTPVAMAPMTPGEGNTPRVWRTGAQFSPRPASLMQTIRHARLQKSGRRGRKRSSSTSGSGYSSMASARTTSPPPLCSVETTPTMGHHTHRGSLAAVARSRRESLALGTDRLQLSSGNDSGDEALGNPSTPGVVRRPVTRRGNLLPKTKGFARIHAALMEEERPVDTDVRREAETIRQVRERDHTASDLNLSHDRTRTLGDGSSPSLLPAVSDMALKISRSAADTRKTNALGPGFPRITGLGVNFSHHAQRNSAGAGFWNGFDVGPTCAPPHMSTAPYPSMDSDAGRVPRSRARSSISDASDAFPSQTTSITTTSAPGMTDDMHLQHFKKRRREDDFDIATIKRRAVSPGMSSQNSPVLAHSPIGAAGGVSVGAAGAPACGAAAPGQRKVGLQGMVDTHDGLMKMSIE